MFYIADGRSSFFQWDTNRQLVVEDASIKEVHFCNRTSDCSLVCETYSKDGVLLVNVPNILLQTDFRIKVYAYDGEATLHEKCFDVIKRSKPEDYVYTETEVKRYEDLEAKVAELEEKVKNIEIDEVPEHTHLLAGKNTVLTPIKLNESNTFIMEGSTEDFSFTENSVGGEGGTAAIKVVSGKYKLNITADDSAKITILNTTGMEEHFIDIGEVFEYDGIIEEGILIATGWGFAVFNTFVKEEEITTDGFMSVADKEKLDNTYSKTEVDNKVGDVEAALDAILKIQNALIGGAN